MRRGPGGGGEGGVGERRPLPILYTVQVVTITSRIVIILELIRLYITLWARPRN